MNIISVPISRESTFFLQVYSLYEASFPEEERRTLDQLEKCFKSPHYRLEAYFLSDIFVAFVEYWILDTFVYIEHLSVCPEFRGKSIGKNIMKDIALLNVPIFLEIELLRDEVTKQRYHFYKNLNFEIVNIQYFQPSYGEGKSSIELLLLASNYDVKNDVSEVIEIIFSNVYQKLK